MYSGMLTITFTLLELQQQPWVTVHICLVNYLRVCSSKVDWIDLFLVFFIDRFLFFLSALEIAFT